jgi:lipopolysaccharide transport system permease protein
VFLIGLKDYLKRIQNTRRVSFVLAGRDVFLRYGGSYLGPVWTLLHPLFQIAIFYFVFAVVMQSGRESFVVWLSIGVIFWIWNAEAIQFSAGCIRNNLNLISNVANFPVEALPVSVGLSTMFNCLIGIPILLALALISHLSLQNIAWLPLVMMLNLIFLVGVGTVLAILGARYRDVQYLAQHTMSFLFFASPIVYHIQAVPAEYRAAMYLNPFYSFIELYRWIFGARQESVWHEFAAVSLAFAIALGVGAAASARARVSLTRGM